ncbi:peptide methionine sulfoxide [Xylona heveae TC161]|uniref:peptide-methionine (S)-S-oxide reductase n=1 Tax=Xylona heveae (strain CBS 132557 / TC161) TaxID=1328760 RepID=A0A161TER9_XYLHT|nr:peptide methionine sulfoxide [Xylona heveae TC161]KZF24447.1 peptide methionine sulfoxide [Xylona heveae TC161]
MFASGTISMMPSFLARLIRPFSSSTHLGLTPDTVAQKYPANAQLATVAAGCFWGVEHMYRKAFAGKGLLDAKVGYIGGDAKHPSYRQVCTGSTGHAEALQIVFDPEQVSYRQLLEFFYRMHDPTTLNSQGPDVGTQYRSAIFFYTDEQERIAKDITEKVQKEWWKKKLSTEIIPAGEWWDAEDYHQLYLDKNPSGYECPSHFLRKFEPLSS